MKRVEVPTKMARKLYELNVNSCCVCKRTGVGLNLHHRPSKYTALNHMDLSAERLHAYKTEWEELHLIKCMNN